MKFRIVFLLSTTILLSACNLTLAEDVTPPPGYIPPTPMPTLGPLFPVQAPNLVNGAAIYTEKCLPCHGETGLGDGEQGLQLNVTVKPFGLPEVARPASPEQYYTVVTRGNIERFMPPFASLTDQERWDVIAYVLTLHTTPEQIATGKDLFETNCANCAMDFFQDQEKMSALSAVELARLLREGNAEVPAFGANLTDDELWAVTAYLRTLSFDTAPLAQPEPVTVTATPIASDAGTPQAETTPVGTEQAAAGDAATPVVRAGYGNVSGSLENQTGAVLPSDLVITLHGFDHASGDNPGAQEVFTQDGLANSDGTYRFENIEMPEGRIFLLEATYSGITLQSELGVVEQGTTELTIPTLVLYKITEDSSELVIDELNIIIHPNEEASYEVYAVYSFRNPGETVVAVKMSDQDEIPFLQFPEEAQDGGYEAVSDSAPLISLDGGFAMAPDTQPYGIIAYATVSRQNTTSFTQSLVLPAAIVRVLVPDGMEVSGGGLVADSPQDIQGALYQMYTVADLKAQDTLTFDITGTPATAENSDTSALSTNDLLIGAGAVLGLGLILAGVWLYWRDRNQAQTADDEDEEEEEEGFENSEEVLDAIIALDDLHRAKKISDAAYQKRRAELKETLKGLM